MPYATTDDNVKLYYEDTGSGTPVVFVHEFAGDFRSWEPQTRHFARRYRCVAYNARGWTPSEVPQDVAAYSQARARDDIRCALDPQDRQGACGRPVDGRLCHAAFRAVLSGPGPLLVVAGAGYGAEKEQQRERFRNEAMVIANKLEKEGMAAFAEAYAYGPTRVQFENKDPAALPSSSGSWPSTRPRVPPIPSSAYSVSVPRSSIWSHRSDPDVPTLILNGDEDWPCLLPGVFMKRICFSGPAADPNSGHTINIEEPVPLMPRLLISGRRSLWPLAHARSSRREPEHHRHALNCSY